MCRQCHLEGKGYDRERHRRLDWWYAGRLSPGWPPSADKGPWLAEDKPPPEGSRQQAKPVLSPVPIPSFLKGLSDE